MKAKIIETSEIFDFKIVYLKDNPNPFYQSWDGKLYYPFELDFCIGDYFLSDLSRMYAEDVCPKEDYLDEKEREFDLQVNQDDASYILIWLAGNYEITLTPRKHE